MSIIIFEKGKEKDRSPKVSRDDRWKENEKKKKEKNGKAEGKKKKGKKKKKMVKRKGEKNKRKKEYGEQCNAYVTKKISVADPRSERISAGPRRALRRA